MKAKDEESDEINEIHFRDFKKFGGERRKDKGGEKKENRE